MSRIGLKPIEIPQGVEVKIEKHEVIVTAKGNTLKVAIPEGTSVKMNDNIITVERHSERKNHKMLHGTVRALIANAVHGLTEGFTKELELMGVGYRVTLEGTNLSLSVGYKHLVKVAIPQDLKVEVPSQTEIRISGIDKQKVGAYAASVRDIKPPEPYKGKGIRYKGEYVRKKEVKTAVA